MENKKKKIIFYFLVSIFWFLFSDATANAATLFFSPSSGDYAVGQTLSVSTYVSSADQSMNAASGVISFPKDKLEIVSLSKTSSIFNLWVQEPSFSNSTGTVNFEGIVLNPGFTGASGKIITINFKVKVVGTALLNFSSGSVLANNGQGTNILASMGNAKFSLGGVVPTLPTAPEAAEKEITPSEPILIFGVPSTPKVFSSTHPDSDKWYNNKNPQFSWVLPFGVNGVSIYLNKSPLSNPGSVSDGLITSKSYENISDGIWYFHIKFKNSVGWGPITHFKFQIDTKPPDPFVIEFVHGKTIIDPSPIITFNTTDVLSGIRYYQIKIGSGSFFEVDPNLIFSNPYALPPQDPGKNTVVVQAYDKAGNTATAADEFEILALESPKITRYQKNIKQGDLLEIGGKTYPDSSVDLFLFQQDKKVLEQRVKSNSSGDFTFIWSNILESGVYDIQAQVIDNRGAKSLLSEKITITVAKSAILRIGTWATGFFTVIIPLVALILALLFILWLGWHKFSLMRKRLRKEVREAGSSMHKAFGLLRGDIQKQIRMLEKTRTKRELTKEEEKIIKQFTKDLDSAEILVKKEINDIEKEVK